MNSKNRGYKYHVFFKNSAEHIFKRLPKNDEQRIIDALFRLAENPFRVDLDIKKLRAMDGACRLRIRQWGIIYIVDIKKQKIEVLDLFLRKGDSDYN